MKKINSIILVVVVAVGIWLYVKYKQNQTVSTEKVLVTVNKAQVKGLDPVHIQDVYSSYEGAKLYEGLLEFHYLKRPFELIPNLAEAMPTVSQDQLVYTFKIRKGVKFHNNACFQDSQGREVKAHDFVYSFKRLADPKLQSANFWILDNKVKGINEWRNKQVDAPVVDYSMEVDGIKALDDYTLQFTLTVPSPQFLYTLAMVPCSVVPHEAVVHYGKEFVNHPVGTGPFILDVFNPQVTKITYHKNPTFRDKFFPSEASEEYKHLLVNAGKKVPFVDKVITYILPEEQPRWLKFKKGEIDIINLSGDKIATEVVRDQKLLPDLEEKGMRLFQINEIGTGYFVFNFANRLFHNLKLRQAMSLAFDGEQFNKLFYNGRGRHAQSTIAPGISGYDANWLNPYRSHSIEKAKHYLAEAGYPGGKGLPEITIDVAGGIEGRQRGEFLQKCLSNINIQAKVVENVFPAFIEKLQKKTTMVHAIGWSADYPDGENFLQLFYGPIQPGGIGSNFNDKTFNHAYEQAVKMPDSPARNEAYEKLNKMVGEQVAAIFTVHNAHISLHQGWIENYCWSNFHYGSELYWDINMDAKKALASKF